MELQHISIIADGNRRWAKSNGLYTSLAYGIAGNYANINKLANLSKKKSIKYLSIWAFSTENWKRKKEEIREIFDTIERGIDLLIENSEINKYRILHLGRKDRIPVRLNERLSLLENITQDFKGFNLVFGIDYGGYDEINRMVNKLLKSKKSHISEKYLNNFLDLPELPSVDLIIRTGGEQRLSGLLPLHSAYSELYFTDKTFPDFHTDDLEIAIEEYFLRKRNFGK